MRLTLGQLKSTAGIELILNVPTTDSRYTKYVNEALERIFLKGENYWGVTQRFVMCVRNGCITLPRQVAAVESIWICGFPITIRNQWFEYLPTGPGLQYPCGQNGQNNNGTCSSNGLLWNGNWGGGSGNSYDRGTACTFRDIHGRNKKIRVYADVAEDADAVINLQGYDENDNWIRTEPDGEGTGWIDGENVAITDSGPTLSTKKFTNLVAVQKPMTNGNVRLYSYNTDDATQIAIAVYEPSETLPVYRRMFIPGLECVPCCQNGNTQDDNQCQLKKVTMIGRMEFIPCQTDADWIIPACGPAIKDMVQCIRWEENNAPDQAVISEGRCWDKLRSQLRHYLGHAQASTVRYPSNLVSNPGGVTSLL